MPNNSSVLDSATPTPQVEQGPRWLAELRLDPPPVFWWVVLVVLCVTVAWAAASLYRNRGIPDGAGPEMLENGLIVVGVLAATYTSMTVLPLPYVGDVLVGWVSGATLGFGASELIKRDVKNLDA